MNLFSKINRQSFTAEEKKQKRSETIQLLLSGGLLGLAFPPMPFPFTLLLFFALVPYFKIIESKETLAEISKKTYITFWAYSLVTLYWVGSWQPTADPFLMISGVVLVFFNPLVFLIASTLYYSARKAFTKNIALFLFPFFWVTYEYLYMITEASFPWVALGNGLPYFNLFIQSADIIGAVGLSLTLIYLNILFYKWWMSFKINNKYFNAYLIWAVSVIILFLAYGIIRESSFKISDEKIRVGIVQPNIDPWDKWSGGSLDEILDLYFGLSQKAIDDGAKLIVWPETALPVFIKSPSFAGSLDSIYNFLKINDVFLLTGMPDIVYYDDSDTIPETAKRNETGSFAYSSYNAIYLMSPYTKKIISYGKMKLVPFGERVPFVDAVPFLGDLLKWGVGLSGWNIGQDTVVFNIKFDEKDSIKLNGLICYESIYPYFVSQFVDRGADIITIVTNDSWYGNLSGPYQHKEIAVLRAVENRKSVVRAANGGVSAIINPLGKTLVESKMLTKDVLVGDVPIQKDETIFTKYSLILPTVSSAISLWIFGIFLLKKIKGKS